MGWMRLKRDKVAMAGGIFIVFLILVAIIGPHLVQSPDVFHPNLINATFSRPNGPWGGISLAHPLGVEPVTGRDMLSRVVVGAQYSLLIGFLATVLAVVIGVFFGVYPAGRAAASGVGATVQGASAIKTGAGVGAARAAATIVPWPTPPGRRSAPRCSSAAGTPSRGS